MAMVCERKCSFHVGIARMTSNLAGMTPFVEHFGPLLYRNVTPQAERGVLDARGRRSRVWVVEEVGPEPKPHGVGPFRTVNRKLQGTAIYVHSGHPLK